MEEMLADHSCELVRIDSKALVRQYPLSARFLAKDTKTQSLKRSSNRQVLFRSENHRAKLELASLIEKMEGVSESSSDDSEARNARFEAAKEFLRNLVNQRDPEPHHEAPQMLRHEIN